MFDFDIWQEILSTIRKNKLRTFLTGFSVSWGIFMLIILLAAGNGLKNGVMSHFANRATNTVEVRAGRTSVAYKGTPQGRRLRLDDKDVELIELQVEEAYNVGAEVGRGRDVFYDGKVARCQMQGVPPSRQVVSGIKLLDGRFINEMDMRERRKVVVIDDRTQRNLFGTKNPMGEYLTVEGLMFQVVGVYDASGWWGGQSSLYVPFTTGQLLFNRGYVNYIHLMVDGLTTRKANEEFMAELRRTLAARHSVDPTDRRAIGIWSEMDNYLETLAIFNGISLFLWIIGIGTLMAGVVGVSNIMLITVRERTREFGIRKALGAKPADILRLILLESVLITALFGYIGMVAGVGVSELVSYVMEQNAGEGSGGGSGTIFKNPTVSLSIALMSTGVLVVAGVLAGYVPARRAIRVTAIEAMRAE